MDAPGPAALLQRLATDPGAWGPLWVLVGDDLRRSVARAVGADLADDAVQEAAIAVAAHAARFQVPAGADPDRAAGIWLRSVAIHAALDLVRGRRRAADRHARAAAREPVPMPDPDPIQAAELRAAVHGALADLPPAMALAVALRHLDGQDTAATARILGRPEGTVKALVARGLARLRGPLRPHAPAVALAVLAGWDPGPAGRAGMGRAAAARPAGRAAPFPANPLPLHRRLLLMSLPVLLAAVAVLALWPAPVRGADPVPPSPVWWTADPLGLVGTSTTLAAQIVVPGGHSLAGIETAPFPPLAAILLERTRTATLLLDGHGGMIVLDGAGVGAPEVRAAMTARCTEAGWPVASATVAGVPALRLGAGISGSLSMELVLGANASTRGAAVPGGGDLQPRLRLGWTPGDAGTDGPSEGILCLAAGPDRLVVGRAGIIAEAMATGLDRPADPDVHWVRGALAARRAEGAVITVAARLVGPPLVVGLAPDAAGLGLVGEIRFTDPATAADWAATADRLRQGADALIDGLEPQLQALFFPRGIPPGGEAAAATALADVRERLAAAVAGLRTRSDGDTVRVVTVLPGYSADRLLDGLSGRQ